VSEQLIASLNAEIVRLRSQVEDANKEAAKYRNARKDATAAAEAARKEAAEVKAALEAATAERDTWKGKAEAAPSEVAKRVKELEGQIVIRDHKDAFRKTLNGKLHPAASIDEVWAAIAYQPGDSLPTDEQITELVGKAQEAKPYLFYMEAPGGPPAAPGAQAPPPGAAGKRGLPDLNPTPKPLMQRLLEQMRAEG
jgi:chromosome segregation ATPase